jgi:hypothetical protein
MRQELTSQRLSADDLKDDDLPEACTIYTYQHPGGRGALIDLLRRELDTTDKKPSEVHFDLLALDPDEILTTNP